MTGPLMSAVLALLVLMPTEPLAEPALELERAVALAEAVAADLVVAKEDVVRVDAEYMTALSSVLPRVDLTLSAGESFSGSPIIE